MLITPQPMRCGPPSPRGAQASFPRGCPALCVQKKGAQPPQTPSAPPPPLRARLKKGWGLHNPLAWGPVPESRPPPRPPRSAADCQCPVGYVCSRFPRRSRRTHPAVALLRTAAQLTTKSRQKHTVIGRLPDHRTHSQRPNPRPRRALTTKKGKKTAAVHQREPGRWRPRLEGNRKQLEGDRRRLEGNRRRLEGNRRQLEGNRR